MARYKPVDRSPRFLAVVLDEQIQPGTFEHALDHLVDRELDLSELDARFNNDETGASAYDPRVMLKIVLLAYSRGLISSRAIERACAQNVQFMALSGEALYSRRIATVEPVFGNLRHNKRLSRFTLRGAAYGGHAMELVLPGAQHRKAGASRIPMMGQARLTTTSVPRAPAMRQCAKRQIH
jgi:hypothetical protein